MTLRLSTNLRNRLLGDPVTRSVATYTASTIAAVDGGSGEDTFTDTANGFVTAGFSVGDSILVYGFTAGAAAVHGPFTLTGVATGTLNVATGLLTANEAGEAVTIVALKGGSLKDIFKDGVLEIYSGSQPATADAAKTGTLLLRISVASGAFVSGAVANGLEFGLASAGAIAKNSEVWSDTGIADGTAGWFRLYANATDAGGADTTPFLYPRIDGAVATSGSELNMSTTSIVTGATTTIDSFAITFPAA